MLDGVSECQPNGKKSNHNTNYLEESTQAELDAEETQAIQETERLRLKLQRRAQLTDDNESTLQPYFAIEQSECWSLSERELLCGAVLVLANLLLNWSYEANYHQNSSAKQSRSIRDQHSDCSIAKYGCSSKQKQQGAKYVRAFIVLSELCSMLQPESQSLCLLNRLCLFSLCLSLSRLSLCHSSTLSICRHP